MHKQYKLGNVLWFYDKKKHVIIPLIMNDDRTLVKDLKSNEIYLLSEKLDYELAKYYKFTEIKRLNLVEVLENYFNKCEMREISKNSHIYNYGRPSKEEIENATYTTYEIKKLAKRIEKVLCEKLDNEKDFLYVG